MIRTWLAIATTLALGACAGTQITQPAQSSAEQELHALDLAWCNAEVAHDRKALEQILDEGFVVTLRSGKTLDRAEFIDFIVGRQIPPFEAVHDVIHVFGDTAIVVDRFGTGLATKATWVAIRREGRWRVVAEALAKIETTSK